jgi:D-inositol-3-phosphate glycosyltransferase
MATCLVDHEQLPLYYNAADVCAFPSFYESFGLVPLESLACGTPVVATEVGDLKHIILDGQTGYVIPNGQAPLLAEKLGLILRSKSPEMRDPNGIRDSISRYDWSNIALLIEGQIRQMAMPKPSLV